MPGLSRVVLLSLLFAGAAFGQLPQQVGLGQQGGGGQIVGVTSDGDTIRFTLPEVHEQTATFLSTIIYTDLVGSSAVYFRATNDTLKVPASGNHLEIIEAGTLVSYFDGSGNLVFGSDAAEAGVIRLSNNTAISAEASPAGDDMLMTWNASEEIAFSGITGLTVEDGDFIGVGSAAERIEFDGTAGQIKVLGAEFLAIQATNDTSGFNHAGNLLHVENAGVDVFTIADGTDGSLVMEADGDLIYKNGVFSIVHDVVGEDSSLFVSDKGDLGVHTSTPNMSGWSSALTINTAKANSQAALELRASNTTYSSLTAFGVIRAMHNNSNLGQIAWDFVGTNINASRFRIGTTNAGTFADHFIIDNLGDIEIIPATGEINFSGGTSATIQTSGTNVDLTLDANGTGAVIFADQFGNDAQQTITLGVGVTTFAVTKNVVQVTGDGGGNTIATITGARVGLYTFIFVDANVVITDDDTHAANSFDLSVGFTSADDTILVGAFDGTSFYEVARSAN